MRSVLLCFALIAACGDDPPPTGPLAATVASYDYRIDLATGAASVVVRGHVDVGGDCWTLPFRAESPTDVTLDGAAAEVDVDVGDGRLTACGGGWRDGETIELAAAFTVSMATLGPSQVGFSSTTDRRNHPFWFLISWVGGCDRFGPCDAAPDRFATYRFAVTHEAGVDVRCPGTIDEVSPTQTVCDFAYAGGPTYSTFGFVASTGWQVTDLGDWGGVRTTLYDTGSAVPAQIDAAYHAGMLAMLSDLFGPYPYGDELRILTGPTYWSGFEHPGNIVLDDGLATPPIGGSAYADPVAHVLDHELAHQWAGDQTTLAGTYDFVWKEAMAEYLAYLHEAMTAPSVAQRTANAWKTFADGAAFFPVPEEQPPLFDYYGEVYGPGPMILFRQLEAYASREAIVAALQAVLGQPRALSVDELQVALEAATSHDLDAYFDAWVRGEGAPVWPRVSASWDGAGTVTVTHTNAATSAGPCRFSIALEGALGERTLVPVDLADGASQALPAAPPHAVTDVLVDPDAQCLVFATAAGAAPTPTPTRRGWSPWRSTRN